MPSFRSHAVRFFGAAPEAITCLAHSRSEPLLAVARADSSVEVWDTRHSLAQRLVIPPPPPSVGRSSVECVAWGGSTLYSCGLHGQVVKYDLGRATEAKRYLVTSGPAWCLAIDQESVNLAVGTEEGFVCLFTISEEGLDYVKVLDRQEGRILCLAWHSDCRHIVTGSTDTIRVWDTHTRHPTARMTTGRVEKAKETIVWCVAVTEDFTVISGDSRGKTSFWNGKLGTLVDSVQSHKADVLSIALSEDQGMAYSTGVDPTLMHFQVIRKGDGRRKWVKSLHRVISSHDVRCVLAVGERLFSGGVDTYLQVSSYPARSFVKLPGLPRPASACVLAAEARAVLLSYPRRLELWRLGSSACSSAGIGARLPLHAEPCKLLDAGLHTGETLRCSSVSSSGGFVAYSTNVRLRVLRLDLGTPGSGGEPQARVSRVKIETEGRLARQMAFFNIQSKDYLLMCYDDGTLETLGFDEESNVALEVDSLSLEESGLSSAVSRLDVVGGVGVVSDSEDRLVVLDLNSLTLLAKLPSYKEASLTCFSVSPSGKFAVLVYSNQKVLEVDLSSARYTDFSNQLSSRLPRAWLSRRTSITGCEHVRDDLVLLHDSATLAVIDKSLELPEPGAKLAYSDPRATPESSSETMSLVSASSLSPSSGKEGGGDLASCGLRMSRKYNHLVAFKHLTGDEVVAVEVKPATIEAQLPPSLKQKKFGGS